MNSNNTNLDPKYIKCAGCSKPAELRWKEGYTLPIAAYKGPNGEELCHKCAPCVKCGKEASKSYENGFNRYEKTNDNPSGEWVLAHCSKECYNGYNGYNGAEKPNLPKKEPEKFHLNANCDHCRKWSEIKVGNAFWGKNFCSGNCYELAFARVPTKQSDEIRAHCCVCGFRIFGQDANFADNFKNRKDKKLHFSDGNFHACYCSETCFEKREDKNGVSCSYGYGHLRYNCGPTQSDNSSKPNPASPTSQPITNSVNPDNSPQPNNPEKDSLSEEKNSVKTIKFESKEDNAVKPTKNSPVKTDNQTLIINLKDIKQITLTSDGDLIIEFNSSASNHSIGQVITTEQISNNQELQKIRNYCQKNGKSVLSQQELNSLINANKTDSALTNKSKDDNNSALTVGLAIAVALIVGLVIGLVVKKRKRN